MAKQSINVGATANDKKGDSLRAAFQKVNANFTELYTQLGLAADDTLNLGNFVFDVNTVRLTNANNDDSTATQIEIAQSVRIESDLTVGGDILPNVNLGGNLGSPTNQFKSLFVSNNTIFIGGTALGVDQSNNLTVAGAAISTQINYASIPNAPADVSDLTDTTDLLVDLSALTQSILPAVTETVDLGSTTKRFRDLFLSGTTIDLGGSTLSNVGGEIQFSGGIRTNITSTGVVGFTRGSDFNTVYATASFDPIGPYPEGLAILDVGAPPGAYLYVPAVYDPILDANDFLIGIALISPGSSYEGADNMLAQGTASATSAFVLQGGQTAGVSAFVPLNPVGGILGSYSATITHDGQTLTVNYTVGGVGETIATVTSFSQTGGFDAAWAQDNNYFHITRFAETVLVPVIYLPPGEVTPVQPAGNQIAIFVKWNTFQETLPTSNVLGQVALAGTTTPTDISDLTDTTGLIPADIGDLTDTGSLLGGGPIPGPYADDSAAAAAGVAIGFTYHKTGTSGQVFVRLV